MSKIYRGQFGRDGSIADPGEWQDAVDALHDLSASSLRRPPRIVNARPGRGSDAERPNVDTAIDALQALARKYGAQPDSDHHPDYPTERGPGVPRPPEPLRTLVRARPRKTLNAVALFVIATAVLTVLLFAASRLSNERYWESAGDPFSRQAALVPASVPAPALTEQTADFRWIERSMIDCDREAARDQEGLYFLIIPVMAGTKDFQSWSPSAVGQGGRSVLLLRSKDMLEGLQDGTLSLYPGRYTFAISDQNGNNRYIWTPSVGLTKLIDRDTKALSRFSVAFGLADDVPQMQSGFGFARERGVCYWVTALIPN